MTESEKQVKIAEACGLSGLHYLSGQLRYNSSHSYVVPDYLNDLNAMHEAEKAVKNVWGKYVKQLNSIADPACATAAQRAEAFGKTLNLW
jgi:hypothetical protein